MMGINRWLHLLINQQSNIAPLVVFRIIFGAMMFASTLRFILKGWVEELYINPTYFYSLWIFIQNQYSCFLSCIHLCGANRQNQLFKPLLFCKLNCIYINFSSSASLLLIGCIFWYLQKKILSPNMVNKCD